MTSASRPPPVIGKSGNLTVFITPPAEPESPGSEFSTPPTSPRAEDSPESPPDTPKAPSPAASPPAPVDSLPTPPLVRTVSPPLAAVKLSRTLPVQVSPPLANSVSAKLQATELPSRPPPPVQVPPPQFDKASPGPNGSALAFFWDAVARVQEAHASLDEHISRWFGLDQSKYQWALNDYYERAGQEQDSGKAATGNCKEQSREFQKG